METPELISGQMLVGLDLFNDDTCPSGHISRPTQVDVSQSCFDSLNKLLKLNYIVQVWGLIEVNCVISDRRIPLLAGIPLCNVTLHTPGPFGQCLTTMVTSSRWSSGQDMGLGGLCMANRSRVITTSSALVKCWNFFGGPSVGFTK